MLNLAVLPYERLFDGGSSPVAVPYSRKEKKVKAFRLFTLLAAIAAAGWGQSNPITIHTHINANPVLTQHNDTNRTGSYEETGFGQSLFEQKLKWGLLGRLQVDGMIYAQPLYAPALMVKGGVHDVLIVATARNHLYAFDAGSLQLLWDTRPCRKLGSTLELCTEFAGPDPTPDDANDGTFIDSSTIDPSTKQPTFHPGIGILSTPVIDPTMQRVYFTYRTGSLGAVEQHVAALDPRDGSIVLDREITGDLSVKVNGVGEDTNGLKQRVSLLLENRILYVAFGAHDEESKPYRGRLLALDSATLHTIGQFKTAPDGQYGGGIWMSSSGIAADEDGYLYFTTGNLQAFSDDTESSVTPNCPVVIKGFKPVTLQGSSQVCAVGDAAVRLNPKVSLDANSNPQSVSFVTQGTNPPGVFDFFMPYRALWHNAEDFDLGSAGVVLIPGTRAMVFGGKEGVIYVVNRDAMGGFDPNHWSFQDYTNNAKFDDKQPFSNACLTDGGQPVVSCAVVNGVSSFSSSTSGQAPPNACPYLPNDLALNLHLTTGQTLSFQHDPNVIQEIAVARASTCASPPMNANLPWPHLNTPAYADFPGGRSFLYVWPEKSALQAYERKGTATSLSFDFAAHSDETAPTSGGFGGLVSVVVDPSGNLSGVVFASVPTSNTTVASTPELPPGTLYAFDPIPDQSGRLRKLWDNTGDPVYGFAKFVPPTIANGRVYLATSTNQVLVYGIPGEPFQ